MERRLEDRMYFLVLYSLSPIQQGIQAGHAALEYSMEYGDERFQAFVEEDKTWIVLNGGTTNDGLEGLYGKAPIKGSLQDHLQTLIDLDVKVSAFREPDLNNALTALTFLVDERIWDRETYPDFVEPKRRKVRGSFTESIEEFEKRFELEYQNYCEKMGGEKIVLLRQFLRQFRFA